MKVLHVLDHSVPLYSGYSFRSRNIIRFQQPLGIKPVVLTSPKQGSRRDDLEEIEGIRYYRTGIPGSGILRKVPFIREAALMSSLARRIGQVARAEKIELIHCHSPVLNGLPALLVARRLGIPLVYEARAFWEDAAVDHGTCKEGSFRYRLSRGLETFLFRKADRVVTICEGMRKELVERGIAAERIEVVPNAVDVEAFLPQLRDQQLAATTGLNGGPVFGFIGSFYHYEGLKFLIESFPEIANGLKGAKLLLVGGGPEAGVLRSFAERFGDTVKFIGQVPHADVQKYYSIVDVLVYPRRSMRLTDLVTPLKPLEAMAMGKAVLASDVGGHKELIRHERTGILFSANSRENLIQEALRIGRDRQMRDSLGESARAFIMKERTWNRAVTTHVKLYSEAKAQRSREA